MLSRWVLPEAPARLFAEVEGSVLVRTEGSACTVFPSPPHFPFHSTAAFSQVSSLKFRILLSRETELRTGLEQVF